MTCMDTHFWSESTHTHTHIKERGIPLQYNLSLVMNSLPCLLRHPAYADKPAHFSLSVHCFYISSLALSLFLLFPSYSTQLIFHALFSFTFPSRGEKKNAHCLKMWLIAAGRLLWLLRRFLAVAAHPAKATCASSLGGMIVLAHFSKTT